MTPVVVVLFDLGGVIVDLTGLDDFLDRHDLDPVDFWPAWLELGAGNDFESGRTTADEFAAAFLRQFDLGVDAGDVTFLDDNLVNVAAADRVGMTGFHARSPDEARTALGLSLRR